MWLGLSLSSYLSSICFSLFSLSLLFVLIPCFFSFAGLLSITFSFVNLVVSLRSVVTYLNVSVYFQVILYHFIYKNLAIVCFHFFNILFSYILLTYGINLTLHYYFCLNNCILKRCNYKEKLCIFTM